MHRYLPLLALAMFASGCASSRLNLPEEDLPADPNATRETKLLYANLKRLAPAATLFGHEDALAYGVNWWREEGRSDVKDVTGAHPAVYGWDVGGLENRSPVNLDGVDLSDMRRWMREAYRRGGVVTVSWHMDNPVTGGNAWDTTPAVSAILPGGSHHDWYRAALDRFADFADALKVGSFTWLGFGEHVPVIFRPFHEQTGSWFWWGAQHCTPEEYRALWHFTVDYLRGVKGIHHLLYAYSTDVFPGEAGYLERYPGDAYVDILGIDDYHTLGRPDGTTRLAQDLAVLVRMAEARGKLAALTETGLEGIPDPTWWTRQLLNAITGDPAARRIAYVLVWRNAPARTAPGHHYAPYAGHPSADDFRAFYRDPLILFEDGLPELYEDVLPAP